MNNEDKLKQKYGVSGGWKVPEGYFDSVSKEIESKLPEYPQEPQPQDMSVWQRIKPYVYLAAMFAGIWCMMKVFHNVSGEGRLNLDNPPALVAQAMADPDIIDYYFMSDTDPDFELESEVCSNYNTIEDFEKDFGYSVEPEYQNMDLELSSGSKD